MLAGPGDFNANACHMVDTIPANEKSPYAPGAPMAHSAPEQPVEGAEWMRTFLRCHELCGTAPARRPCGWKRD